MKNIISALVIALGYGVAEAAFNGLNMSMGNLATISDAQSRSISPENFTGTAGSGGMASTGQLTNKTTSTTPRTLHETSDADGRSIPTFASRRGKLSPSPTSPGRARFNTSG